MNALFFDIDGTLFDTKADLAATVNHARRDLGLAEWPEDRIVANVGRGAKHLLVNSVPECLGPEASMPRGYEELRAIFLGRYAEHCCERVAPYPGVRRTLDELRDRGWLMGVNTNKPNFAVKMILEKFGFTRYFGSAVVAGGDGFELKPSAQPLHECASRLRGHRLSPQDWMVGDNWTDMQCASAAGIKGAFCTFGFGQLQGARFNVKIGRIEELLRHLKAED
ncbi:MAG: HAD hydrolase-like protein [Kiritimatiellae bacterium]|nr:HAD hydrolase-like protein [Kiritimatiellia bacterium]